MKHRILLLLVVIINTGCGTKSDKKEDFQLLADSLAKNIDVFKEYRLEYGGYYALLSAKYNLDTSLVESLFKEYFEQQDILAYLDVVLYEGGSQIDSFRTVKINLSYTLDQLSTKYSIPKSTLASIIIDYKLLKQVKEIYSNTQSFK